MPDRKARRDNGRVRAQPGPKQRVNPGKANSSSTESAPESRTYGLGADYSQGTFEHHAALLNSMSHPMYAQQRATIAGQLQRDYGNFYVQRPVDHIKVQRAKAAEDNNQKAQTPGVVGHDHPDQAPTQIPELMMKPEAASAELKAMPNQDQAVPPSTQQLSEIQRTIIIESPEQEDQLEL